MRFEVSALVRAPLDDVWAWWTDFGKAGEVQTISHGLGWSRRTILQNDGEVVVFREALPLLGIRLLRRRVDLAPAERAFRESSPRYASSWRFEAVPEGTRIRREVDTDARLPARLLAWTTRVDLEHHAREAERALVHA